MNYCDKEDNREDAGGGVGWVGRGRRSRRWGWRGGRRRSSEEVNDDDNRRERPPVC